MLGGAALNRTVQSPGSNLSARVMPRSMEGPGTRRGFVRLGGGAGLPPPASTRTPSAKAPVLLRAGAVSWPLVHVNARHDCSRGTVRCDPGYGDVELTKPIPLRAFWTM
jgi:hypothetical protein